VLPTKLYILQKKQATYYFYNKLFNASHASLVFEKYNSNET